MDHEAVGSVSSHPPRKYTTCGEGSANRENERAKKREGKEKVNKNLGGITVPRGKLRLISCSHPSLPPVPFSPSPYDDPVFPSCTRFSIIFHPPRGVLLSRAVTTYRPRKRGLRQIVTYFTFFPKGCTVSFLTIRPSSIVRSILSPFHLGAFLTADACKRLPRVRCMGDSRSPLELRVIREPANRTRKIAIAFAHVATPRPDVYNIQFAPPRCPLSHFNRNPAVRDELDIEEREKEKRASEKAKVHATKIPGPWKRRRTLGAKLKGFLSFSVPSPRYRRERNARADFVGNEQEEK